MAASNQSFKGQSVVATTVEGTTSVSSALISGTNVETAAGGVRRGVTTQTYHAACAHGGTNWTYTATSGSTPNWSTTNATTYLAFPLTNLEGNDRIRSVKGFVTDGNTAVNDVTMKLFKTDPNSQTWVEIGSDTSSPSASLQILEIGSLTETVDILTSPQRTEQFVVVFTQTGNVSTKTVYGVELEVDRVA